MLCAKYDYKADIAVKQKEAFDKGLSEGINQGIKKGIDQGVQQKAIEDAKNLLKMNLGTPEQISKATNLSIKKILELKKENSAE